MLFLFHQLDEPNQYGLFARSIPSDVYNVVPLLEYLSQLGIQHVALITLNEAFGNSFGQSFEDHAQSNQTNLKVRRIIITDEYDETAIAKGLKTLKDSEYRYVIAIMYTLDGYNLLMLEAKRMGLTGRSGYQWFFPNSFQEQTKSPHFPKDSPLADAYRGVGLFSTGLPSDGTKHDSEITEKSKEFAAGMKGLKNGPDLAYLNTIMPAPPNDTKWLSASKSHQPNRTKLPNLYLDRFNASKHGLSNNETFVQPFLDSENFLDPILHDDAAFAYDATIMMGLGACLAANASNNDAFDGYQQFDKMLSSSFRGVTGEVLLDPKTGSRLFNTSTFKIENFVSLENGTHVIFERVLTDVYRNASGIWEQVTSFIYGDGSKDRPPDLSPVHVNHNYINRITRGTALTFCSIAICSAIGFAIWTWMNRNTRVVKASQPFFLYVICFGVVILASKVIPSTMDQKMASKSALDKGCNGVVWLFCLGVSLILSALWAKTFRINRIMRSAKQFQRIKVTVIDTLKPMALLLTGEFEFVKRVVQVIGFCALMLNASMSLFKPNKNCFHKCDSEYCCADNHECAEPHRMEG